MRKMKKFTLLFVLLLTASLFAGCASLSKEEFLAAIGDEVEFQTMEYTSVILYYKKSVATNKPALEDGGYTMHYVYIENNPENPKYLSATFKCDGSDINTLLLTEMGIFSYNEQFGYYQYQTGEGNEAFYTLSQANEKFQSLLDENDYFRFGEDYFFSIDYNIKKTKSGYTLKCNANDEKYTVDEHGYIQSYEKFPKKLDPVVGSIRHAIYTYNDPIDFNYYSSGKFNDLKNRFHTEDVIELFKSLNGGHLL